MQRTVPAVSFTVSHRALAMRSSKTLLGGGMNSFEKMKASWAEMPLHWAVLDFQGFRTWMIRMQYELGLRDFERSFKLNAIMMTALATWTVLAASEYWSVLLHAFIYREWPEHCGRGSIQGLREHGKKYGKEVWYADGKFTQPLFHINPPYFTMTADEL